MIVHLTDDEATELVDLLNRSADRLDGLAGAWWEDRPKYVKHLSESAILYMWDDLVVSGDRAAERNANRASRARELATKFTTKREDQP